MTAQASRPGVFAVRATRNGRPRPRVTTTVNPVSSNLPFGFGPGSGGSGDPNDPLGLFAQLQQMLSWSGGPVNWNLARQLAGTTLGSASREVSAAERAAVADAVRLADHWLDEVTELPSGVRGVESWTRREWLEKTLPNW
ncbi:MAG: hypothetical protein EPN43_08900, partial [Jatrophihabitans sp.]